MDETLIWTTFLCFWLAVFGAALGSFLDCAVSRWAVGEPWHKGRSRCAACGRGLGAGDLVPVFSYLVRRGKCRYCGGKIPAECLWAELAGALALACLGWRFGLTLELGQWLALAALLLAVSLADWNRRMIPDRLLLAMTANRLVWFLALGQGVSQALDALLACAVPAAVLALVLLLEKLSDREVMGGGDIKLLFALALYLSWAQMLLTLLAGCALGLLWAALTGGRRGTALPFGPFLAAGAVLTAAFGDPALAWYFGLF